MRYFFLELKDQTIYDYSKEQATRNYPLEDLFQILHDPQMSRWIEISEDEDDPRKVIIWSRLSGSLKDMLKPTNFEKHEDFLKYVEQCQKYRHKRFKEMPRIHIFKDNLEFLQQQWEGLYKRKPKCLIFREHDNGYVDILEQDELSQEDLANIQHEHKIYLNYLKRWHAYCKAHPEKRNPVWRSPADDEYESDFALYDPIDEQGVDE
jgi:hypothetical protein